MADVDEIARRREIRRRKILDNSEARLRKITQGYRQQYEVGSWKAGKADGPGSNTGTLTQGSDCSNSSADTLLFDGRSKTDNCHIYKDEFIEEISCSGSSSDPSISQANGVTQRQFDVYTFPKKVSDAETRSYGRTRADSRRNSTCKQLMMETLQFTSLRCTIVRPWLVLATAVTWKLVLLFGKFDCFLQNLLLPYLLLELSLYIWIKLETRGSPVPLPPPLLSLSGVLLLSGVSPAVISSFTNLWNLLHCIIKDFALYFFSFVVVHIFLESYL